MRNRPLQRRHCELPKRVAGGRCAKDFATSRRTAFSLIELIVVMAVAVVLTGLLMPSMSQLRENAHRIICMSNLKQLGQAFASYSDESKDQLPYSAVLHTDHQPQNLMVAWRGATNPNLARWDGLGLLYSLNYCGASECYYCPSHHGDHPFDRYAGTWEKTNPGGQSIYTNYHYAGDIDWQTGRRRNILDGATMVLATDGLRTAKDFNHLVGMNVLRGDISVRWREDKQNIRAQLPLHEFDVPQSGYSGIWTVVESQH